MALASCRQEDQPPQVGLCIRSLENGIYAESVPVLEEALKRAGYQLQIMDAKNDQTKQNSQIQTLIQDQVDLVIIEPVMVSAAEKNARTLKNARIPCIFIHREPEQAALDLWDQLCFLGPDTTKLGKTQVEVLQQAEACGDLNGDGIVSYVCIGGPEDDMDAQLRVQQTQEAMDQLPVPAQCLQTYWGDWNRKAGEHAATQALARFGKDVEVILCADDELAIGGLEGIADGGRTVNKDIYLIGIDGIQHALVLVRSEEITGTAALDLNAMAEKTLQLSERLLKGKKVEDRCYVDYAAVTLENIDEFMG